MPRRPTVTSDNIFCKARLAAMKNDSRFSSREKASGELGISPARLADIEADAVTPSSDEVWTMAKAYDAPELCNAFCTGYCRVGRETMTKINLAELESIVMRLLFSCEKIEELRSCLLEISHDGRIDLSERDEFRDILAVLNDISNGAQSLDLWSKKNL